MSVVKLVEGEMSCEMAKLILLDKEKTKGSE